MIKKFFLLIFLLSAFVSSCRAAASGSWRIHAKFVSANIQNIVDAGDDVYYLASGNLFRFNKKTCENEALNKANDLYDSQISNIYYNDYKDYLLIVYANANIDVITKEGKVVNMPDIYSASFTGDKSINHVTFSPDNRAYVATNFGYIVFNDKKWEVLESHIYNQPVASVAVVGDYIILSSNQTLYYGKTGKYYDALSAFNASKQNTDGIIYPISDTRFLFLTGWTFCIDFTAHDDGTLSFSQRTLSQLKTDNVQKTPSGYLGNCFSQGHYYTLDEQGDNYQQFDGTTEMYSANDEGDGTLWMVGPKGLHSSADSACYKPNALSIDLPVGMTYNAQQNLLYVASSGTNRYTDAQHNPTAINTYDGTTWMDATPAFDFDQGGTYTPVFIDGSTYLLPSWWAGIFKVTDGKVVYNYNWENSPMQFAMDYYCYPTMALDRNGNLWAVQASLPPGSNTFVLPQGKLAQPETNASDWMNVNVPNIRGTKWAKFLCMRHNDLKVYADGSYQGNLIVFTDNGTPASSVKSATWSYNSVYDKDEVLYTWLNITALAEDQSGMVWMGTTNGVVSFNPADALQSNFRVNRIKVPRNDGTNLADYLLNGLQVNCIAVDAANRKWLGTNSSGLFLVSADGTEILQSFNTANSPLLSDRIYDICCNPNNNAVYVTTEGGVMEYLSNNAPAQNSYDNVYAYPNPVRPDYYGNITITGLMENSLVKIADVAGNVVKQLKSTGGTVAWDGCGSNAERVQSGVYFIIASHSGDSGNEAVVAKILIMR